MRERSWLDRLCAPRAVTQARSRRGLDCAAAERPDDGPELLEHAADLVRQRRREYGEPVDLFRDIAKRWSLVLGVEVSPAHAVLCMLDVKMARLSRDPRHVDSITDLAGYSGALWELLRDA